ncbi:MAG: hypothetical protein KHX20_09515 [Megasphaera sp.]|nr:hypothetical protein [Megasphaera sp.]
MKKISKDELKRMLMQLDGWHMLSGGVDNMLVDTVYKQMTSGTWGNGNPKRIFRAHGYYCVQYQNGMWWHYDLINKLWF